MHTRSVLRITRGEEMVGFGQGAAEFQHMSGAMGRAIPEEKHQIRILHNLTVAAQRSTASIASIVWPEFRDPETMGNSIILGRGIHTGGSAGNNLGGVRRQIPPQIPYIQSS